MFLIVTCTILMILGFLAASSKQHKLRSASGEYRYVLKPINAFYLVAVLVIVSTLRYGFVDTYAYKEMYQAVRDNFAYIFSGAGWGIEPGWLFINYCLNFLSPNPKLILFISALVINFAYLKLTQRYSEDASLSFFIFFCLIYMDTNNGLRQMVAAAAVMLAFPLLEKKSYLPFILLIFVAYQIHNSAIVWLIVMVAIFGKPLNVRTFLALALGVLFLFIPGVVTGFIYRISLDNQYNFYLDMSGGMRMTRALVTGVIPTFLALIYYFREKKAGRKMEKSEVLLFNVLIINTMFILMGTYMQYWNRFAFYTFFAPVVLMPKLARKVFGEKLYFEGGFRILMIILYFAYFSYNIYSNGGFEGSGSNALQKFYIEWWN